MWDREAARRRGERRQVAETPREPPVLARQPVAEATNASPQLRDWEEQESLRYVEGLRLDDLSVRAVQVAIGTPPTGWWTKEDAQAFSKWRVANGLTRGGKLTGGALDALVRTQAAAGNHDELIHLVADYFDLDLQPGTLSVRFDATLTAVSGTSFDGLGLKLITIGPAAFRNARALFVAIRKQLDEPSFFGASGPPPQILTDAEAKDAADANSGVFQDSRSVHAVQAVLGAKPTGQIDADTAQFIAASQQGRGVMPTGLLDEPQLLKVVEELLRRGELDALVRIVVDFFTIPEVGVLDVKVDPDLGRAFAVRSGGTGTPATLTFGTIGGSPAGVIHLIAHAYEDVRLRRERRSADARRFLGYKVEILSDRLPEEDVPGFVSDATAALDRFLALDVAEQIDLWEAFVETRGKVQQRLGPTTGNEALQARYWAVQPPVRTP
ncbi:hypothetical protein OJ997_03235 [Solirubrobacter phytolaccae]|uniref:Peptidoglycan binding-like domain-containing protein n=1 Tax=Solirubrobacter phytolaccae TaxID=1404360 RepID=A0A9X3S5U1_9ACTN|nr:hypothetical protein [Solirubrobacter phytolaccae]MDA0179299.1 hypothetical protein [Solirubrobacter phytolaccae]